MTKPTQLTKTYAMWVVDRSSPFLLKLAIRLLYNVLIVYIRFGYFQLVNWLFYSQEFCDFMNLFDAISFTLY